MSIIDVLIAHCSMQYSDSKEQKEADAEKLFARCEKRGVHWVTGTEGGEQPLRGILKGAADRYGYTFHEYKGNWVSVSRSIILPGTYEKGAKTVVDNDLVVGPGHDLNYVWAGFTARGVGKVTVIASHLATRGRQGTDDPNFNRNTEENKKLAKAIGDFTRERGRGRALVFYGGDQNDNDKFQDTFFGQPLTSVQDELKKWEKTHWAAIDVIASYDRDGRVKAKSVRVLDDEEFFLNSDHRLLEASYDITPLKKD